MGKERGRPLLVIPSMPYPIIGNGKVTELDRILKSKDAQDAYSQLLKKMKSDPERVAEALRTATWKGKSLDDILLELGSD